MSLAFKLKMDFRKVNKRLKSFASAIKDRTKLNKRIAEKGLREIDKQFRTEGVNFGTPWEPLAPSTLRQRRKGKKGSRGGTKILRDTGVNLANTFAAQADSKNLIIGTAADFAKYHQGQPDQENPVLPKRPILPEDEKTAYEKIAEPVIEDYIKNEIKKVNK